MCGAVGVLVGLGIATRFDFLPQTKAKQEKNTSFSAYSPFALEKAIIDVAGEVGEAVVSISAEYTRKVGGAGDFYFGNPFEDNPLGEDDLLRRFFDDFFGDMLPKEFKQRGLGSGVIIDEEGYILTNEHVVREADKIKVTLPDGRKFDAELKGSDARSDLAIIKIKAKNLPVAELGDSEDVRIGQIVIAIGNPFGFALENPEPTVTMGVVSALHRNLGGALMQNRDYGDLIQTDAAINPGNSGGPLVNLNGEIVGINVAIVSSTGGYQGLGFAIPINSAKLIVGRLIEGKKILYGWLGVQVQDLDEELAGYFNLKDTEGVLVAKVLENSPAEKAGMQEGDIIEKFDGKDIDSVRELLKVVGRTEVGKSAKVNVIRSGKEKSFSVEVGERPEDLEGFGRISHGRWRGLEVEEITDALVKKYRLREKEGVIVISVEPNSSADEAGFQLGDLILQINKQNVNDLKDYNEATKSVKGDCLIRTHRGYIILKEAEKEE